MLKWVSGDLASGAGQSQGPPVELQHRVESERLHRAQWCAVHPSEGEAPSFAFEALVGVEEGAEPGRVDKREVPQVENQVRVVDLGEEVGEPWGGREIELAADEHDSGAVHGHGRDRE